MPWISDEKCRLPLSAQYFLLCLSLDCRLLGPWIQLLQLTGSRLAAAVCCLLNYYFLHILHWFQGVCNFTIDLTQSGMPISGIFVLRLLASILKPSLFISIHKCFGFVMTLSMTSLHFCNEFIACSWHLLCRRGQLVPVAHKTCGPLSGFHKGQRGVQEEVEQHIQ